MKFLIFSLIICLTAISLQAQTSDSAKSQSPVVVKKDSASSGKLKLDATYLAKLNTRGNLMIAGGVGLNLAGGYLLYQGVKIYNTKAPDNCVNCDKEQLERDNKRQGTIYLAAGGTAIAGGIVLTALGAKAKVEFKRAKKYMSLHSGIKPDGSLFLAFRF